MLDEMELIQFYCVWLKDLQLFGCFVNLQTDQWEFGERRKFMYY